MGFGEISRIDPCGLSDHSDRCGEGGDQLWKAGSEMAEQDVCEGSGKVY